MTSLRSLSGLSDDARRKLEREVGIKTVTRFWAYVGKHGIEEIASYLDIDADRLEDILADQAARERDDSINLYGSWFENIFLWLRLWSKKGGNILKDNWLVLLILLLVASLAVPVIRHTTFNTYILVTSDRIPAYHLVAEANVSKVFKRFAFGAFDNMEEAMGRYALEDIPAGALLKDAHLSRIRIDDPAWQERVVLTICVASESFPLAVPGREMSLLISTPNGAENAQAGEIVEDVFVLEKNQRDGKSLITIAVHQNRAAELREKLGKAVLYLIVP